MSNSPLKYQVLLSPEARVELEALVRKSSAGVAKIRRAKILLLADAAHPDGGYPDWEIAEEVGLCDRQVVRIRQKFVKSGVAPTLTRAVRSDTGTRRVIDGRAEAQLVTIACSTPPEGRDHWTLQMLCDELSRLRIVKSVCCETVRQILKKQTATLGFGTVLHRRSRPAAVRRANGRNPRCLPRSVRRPASADLHG
jgi:Homeodomain-like domain